jgi:DNA-binding MarR family transcriptional regulator
MTALTAPATTEALAEALRAPLLGLANKFRRQNYGLPLTMTQGPVLGHLLDHPTRMSELARREGVQLPTMTTIVTRMENLGLVERTMAPGDRRAVEVHITRLGRQRVAEVVNARREYIRQLLESLTDEERHVIEAAIPVIAKMATHDEPRR